MQYTQNTQVIVHTCKLLNRAYQVGRIWSIKYFLCLFSFKVWRFCKRIGQWFLSRTAFDIAKCFLVSFVLISLSSFPFVLVFLPARFKSYIICNGRERWAELYILYNFPFTNKERITYYTIRAAPPYILLGPLTEYSLIVESSLVGTNVVDS